MTSHTKHLCPDKFSILFVLSWLGFQTQCTLQKGQIIPEELHIQIICSFFLAFLQCYGCCAVTKCRTAPWLFLDGELASAPHGAGVVANWEAKGLTTGINQGATNQVSKWALFWMCILNKDQMAQMDKGDPLSPTHLASPPVYSTWGKVWIPLHFILLIDY